MSEDELEEIEARANAATDGPWEAKFGGNAPSVDAGYEWTCEITSAVYTCDDELDGCPADARQQDANARFMAHAREDVPALVAEVRRLQREVARLHGMLAAVGQERLCEQQDAASQAALKGEWPPR